MIAIQRIQGNRREGHPAYSRLGIGPPPTGRPRNWAINKKKEPAEADSFHTQVNRKINGELCGGPGTYPSQQYPSDQG
jgi:hypothetical protein